MSYTALYRKFRPSHFDDVKGQEHIVTTLQNQIKANRLGHAYLFCGTRGTGKTTVAKILAKTVNCEMPIDGNACGQCRSCRAIAAGASMNVIEIDAASNNGVDNIREIVDEVSYSPADGKYKVYIIDEVHMLSIGAFNALLKTLEEPPSYVIFILATTEAHKIPITILSRCQRYDFKRIGIDTITDRLKELVEQEQVAAEEKALRYVAKAADGSLRDALSLLDQCLAFHFGQELTYEKALDVLGAVNTAVFSKLLRAVLKKEVLQAIQLLEDIVMQGRELTQFVTDFTWYLRNLLVMKTLGNDTEDGAVEELVDMSAEHLKHLAEEAALTEAEMIMRYIRIFSELSAQIRYASQKRVMIELAIIKLCKPSMEVNTDTLMERIRDIEAQLENGIAVLPSVQTAAAGIPEPLKERPPMPKAIPEDIKQIVGQWVNIVGRMEMPMKLYLKNAKLSLGADNQLMIVVEEGLASDYLKQPDNKARLETIISNSIEKEVQVTIQCMERGRNFQENYVDLAQFIHMEIEEE